MYLSSTDVLRFMAANDARIFWDQRVPRGVLRRDFVSVRDRDGRHLTVQTSDGSFMSPVTIPSETVADFLRASFIAQDGPPGEDGTITFSLTADERIRGAGL